MRHVIATVASGKSWPVESGQIPMTPETFEQELGKVLRRDPFEPFIVELLSGRQITIDRPAVPVHNGGAGFLSDDEGLVDFDAAEVRRIVVMSGKDVKR